jgi:2-amino-4-hydroxy-6-hydroxymethyldihydropteridine diphosphokinase
MTRYAIALGSNLGDRVGHLRAAVGEIGHLGAAEGISGLYETAPVGGPDQDPYLNAVMVVESSLAPPVLLGQLQAIESAHHRERAIRWGPRTLDLDVITMDGGTVDTPEVEVPHPRAVERRFVLEPLHDVWPEAQVGGGLTAAEARKRVVHQDVDRLASRWVDDGPAQGRYWVGAQLLLFLAIAVALVMDGSLPWATEENLLMIGDQTDGWRIVGGVLVIVGGIGIVATARSLGRALTALPEPVQGADLVQTGLYAYVRHPMYGAILVAMFGASLLLASTAATLLSLGLLVFFWAKSNYEERQLRIAYPGYMAYRNRVRRRMIPFLI